MFSISIASYGQSDQTLIPQGLNLTVYEIDDSDPVALTQFIKALALLNRASATVSGESFGNPGQWRDAVTASSPFQVRVPVHASSSESIRLPKEPREHYNCLVELPYDGNYVQGIDLKSISDIPPR